jgi:exonuclease SbcC
LAEKAASDLATHIALYDRVGASSEDLRRRAHLTDRAQLVCRGQVGSKVSLSRWVLGRELDRVVAAASVHLAQMTSGRYTLRRVVEASGGRSAQGLELEVLDAHTGRPRSPRTLSGGEQFQASLALALGLADVVSRGGTGSGRRIEALFVDEGFGSLDPRALDDAIETLHQLHASGRMVGAITHVEAMKERLHPGIVVTRLPDGKGSTLRVNP